MCIPESLGPRSLVPCNLNPQPMRSTASELLPAWHILPVYEQCLLLVSGTCLQVLHKCACSAVWAWHHSALLKHWGPKRPAASCMQLHTQLSAPELMVFPRSWCSSLECLLMAATTRGTLHSFQFCLELTGEPTLGVQNQRAAY